MTTAIRFAVETLRPRQALVFVDELDIALLPKTGYAWMRKDTQTEVLTPGKNEKQYLAGGWDVRTGVVWPEYSNPFGWCWRNVRHVGATLFALLPRSDGFYSGMTLLPGQLAQMAWKREGRCRRPREPEPTNRTGRQRPPLDSPPCV